MQVGSGSRLVDAEALDGFHIHALRSVRENSRIPTHWQLAIIIHTTVRVALALPLEAALFARRYLERRLEENTIVLFQQLGLSCRYICIVSHLFLLLRLGVEILCRSLSVRFGSRSSCQIKLLITSPIGEDSFGECRLLPLVLGLFHVEGLGTAHIRHLVPLLNDFLDDFPIL